MFIQIKLENQIIKRSQKLITNELLRLNSAIKLYYHNDVH